ncbi:PKD domain-containing protein, partial [Flavobacterium hauense]
MKKVFYIVLFIFSILSSQAQMQTAHWYFGANAGVDFSSGLPIAVTDGMLNTKEGTSSISDEFGNLLFYTDGVTVYTQSHSIMPNGGGLSGSGSSSQSALIVPGPGASDLFYIFTTDAVEISPKYGFSYTVVDMALGTEGEVVSGQKNIPISLGGENNVSEKIAATVKGDCSGYWIITYYKKKFYVFSLTEEGIDIANPVISGSIPFTGSDDTVGGIKVSPDGSKLAACFTDYNGSLLLYNFNNVNGTISNGQTLFESEPFNDRSYYSVEFSPNSKVLYATYSGLARYDLTAASIPDSEVVFYNTPNGTSGALQIGLDGKIYYARLNNQYYLAAINDPNNFAAPDLDLFSVFLGGKLHALGLTGFPQPFYNANIFINGKQDIQTFCAEEPIDFSYCFSGGVLPDWTVHWNFGDGNTSTEESPVHSYSESGSYTITLEITIGQNVIKVTNSVTIVTKPKANKPLNLVVCDILPNNGFSEFLLSGQTAAILDTQPTTDYTVMYYASEDDAKAKENPLPLTYTNTTTPQTIYARISNVVTGCYDITSFTITVNPMPEVIDPDDQQACEETPDTGIAQFDLTQSIPQITGGNVDISVKFYKTQEDRLNDIAITAPTAYSNTTPYGETVYFQALNSAVQDCKSNGSLNLIVNSLPKLNTNIPAYKECDNNNPGDGYEVFDLTSMYPAITPDPGLTLIYEYETSGVRISINDPSSFTNTETGQQTIYVSATTSGCKKEANFMIEVNPLPVLSSVATDYIINECEEVPDYAYFHLDEIALSITDGA